MDEGKILVQESSIPDICAKGGTQQLLMWLVDRL